MKRMMAMALVFATAAASSLAQDLKDPATPRSLSSDALEAQWMRVRRLDAGSELEVTLTGREPERASFVSADAVGLTIRRGDSSESVSRVDVREVRGPVVRKGSGLAALGGAAGGLLVGAELGARGGGAWGWMAIVLPVGFGFAAYYASKHTTAPLVYRAP